MEKVEIEDKKMREGNMTPTIEFLIPEAKKEEQFDLVYWNTSDDNSLMEDMDYCLLNDYIYLTFYADGLMFSLIREYDFVYDTLKRYYDRELNEDSTYLLPIKAVV